MLRLQWTSFAAEYRKAEAELREATVDFKEEVQLAHVQDGFRKHAEVLSAINGSVIAGFKTNITLPRNEKFTGRDGILALLHSILEPSSQGAPEKRVARSALIHALGGMGKTETALEYTYRHRQSYDCILWLRAESRAVLMESFLGVIRLLGIAPDHLAAARKIRMGLQWFQSCGIPTEQKYNTQQDLLTISQRRSGSWSLTMQRAWQPYASFGQQPPAAQSLSHHKTRSSKQ
jgi:hypothetical protein